MLHGGARRCCVGGCPANELVVPVNDELWLMLVARLLLLLLLVLVLPAGPAAINGSWYVRCIAAPNNPNELDDNALDAAIVAPPVAAPVGWAARILLLPPPPPNNPIPGFRWGGSTLRRIALTTEVTDVDGIDVVVVL